MEILERAKKGFLGIGASPAKVRVTYEAAEEPKPAPAPVRPAEVRKPVPPRAPGKLLLTSLRLSLLLDCGGGDRLFHRRGLFC